jgi:hypothetical protein
VVQLHAHGIDPSIAALSWMRRGTVMVLLVAIDQDAPAALAARASADGAAPESVAAGTASVDRQRAAAQASSVVAANLATGVMAVLLGWVRNLARCVFSSLRRVSRPRIDTPAA